MKRFLTFLIILVVLVGGFGFYRGWFTVSKASGTNGSGGVTLSMNKDKLKSDLNKAKNKVKSLGSAAIAKIKGVAKPVNKTESQFSGKIAGIDPIARTLSLEVDGDTIPLHLGGGVSILSGASAATLADLAAGNIVKVTVKKDGKSMTVTKIEATK